MSVAQTDTNQYRGTIHVAKAKDSVYIKAETDFSIYYKNPNSNFNYSDFVRSAMPLSKSIKQSGRIKITEAKPINAATEAFDYSAYFRNSKYLKDIKLRNEETDTVRLLVYVSNEAEIKFIDLGVNKVMGKDTVYFDLSKQEYKIDVVHKKTERAFQQLANEKWAPAKIEILKKHPSKYKDKYDTEEAIMQGILTIIFSTSPF